MVIVQVIRRLTFWAIVCGIVAVAGTVLGLLVGTILRTRYGVVIEMRPHVYP